MGKVLLAALNQAANLVSCLTDWKIELKWFNFRKVAASVPWQGFCDMQSLSAKEIQRSQRNRLYDYIIFENVIRETREVLLQDEGWQSQ